MPEIIFSWKQLQYLLKIIELQINAFNMARFIREKLREAEQQVSGLPKLFFTWMELSTLLNILNLVDKSDLQQEIIALIHQTFELEW